MRQVRKGTGALIEGDVRGDSVNRGVRLRSAPRPISHDQPDSRQPHGRAPRLAMQKVVGSNPISRFLDGDIAYSDSPAASRASARSLYSLMR